MNRCHHLEVGEKSQNK